MNKSASCYLGKSNVQRERQVKVKVQLVLPPSRRFPTSNGGNSSSGFKSAPLGQWGVQAPPICCGLPQRPAIMVARLSRQTKTIWPLFSTASKTSISSRGLKRLSRLGSRTRGLCPLIASELQRLGVPLHRQGTILKGIGSVVYRSWKVEVERYS